MCDDSKKIAKYIHYYRIEEFVLLLSLYATSPDQPTGRGPRYFVVLTIGFRTVRITEIRLLRIRDLDFRNLIALRTIRHCAVSSIPSTIEH